MPAISAPDYIIGTFVWFVDPDDFSIFQGIIVSASYDPAPNIWTYQVKRVEYDETEPGSKIFVETPMVHVNIQAIDIKGALTVHPIPATVPWNNI